MVKLGKKKKVLIIISCVLIVAIGASAFGIYHVKNKGTAVQFTTVEKKDITSVINANADIQSGSHKEYKVGTVATVKEVFVKVGDRVTQGQTLATFDTSALDRQMAALEQQYSSSKSSYDSAVSQANAAKAKMREIDAQVANLQAQADKAKEDASSSSSDNSEIPQEVMDRLQKALSEATSVDQIPEIIKKTLEQAVADGLISAEQMEQLLNSSADTVTSGTEALSLEMQIAVLKIQRQVYEVTAGSTVTDVTKGMMDTNSQALALLRSQRDELAKGWVADFSGLISEVNIVSGGEANLLKAGIVLEGTDTMTAVITVGKYDIQKISVGMPCKISVVNGEYDGEISFIAPTATGGSSGGADVLGGMGSMLGISGLDSLTSTAGGISCEITIKEPDDKIIIGLDANVEIILGTKEDVVAIPVEALKMDKEGKYCFVYNEDDKTVEKRTITVGDASDTFYEVTDGLKKGDKVAISELANLDDGVKVYENAAKTAKK